jgi:DNA-binding NarL/FixJ family response regulator
VIRVAVLADSPVVRAGLTSLLASEPDIAVTPLGADAMLWAPGPGLPPHADVLFVDAGDHDALAPPAPVVLLLPALDAAVVMDAVRHGAQAVLTVDADGDALLAAVRAVAAGLAVVPRALLADVTASSERATPVAASPDGRPALTPREREVLALLAEGLANKAISARLGITEHTVKTHVAAVYDKLRARSRAEAVVAAARQGLLIL